MLETIVLFILVPLAALGVVYIIYIIGEIKEYCNSKRKEQFKQDVLSIVKEHEEKTDA